MIYLIIKSYFTLLVSVSVAALMLFVSGFYWIFATFFPLREKTTPDVTIALEKTEPLREQDVLAIAGDDVVATQLDLARAFIEADKKSRAKAILTSIMATGLPGQQQEAERLLNTL